jgi:hypothetical protein
MRRSRLIRNVMLSAAVVAAAPARTVFAQAGRIPPEYIEDWFSNRLSYAALFGVVAGSLAATAWLPRLLPAPHANDVARARRRFYFALVLSTLILGALLLLDVSMNYRFGPRSYSFRDYLFQVWMTWRGIVLLLLGAAAFTFVVAIVTRVSSRFYRYMLIPR